MGHTIEDLNVLVNPIEVIRKNVARYLGGLTAPTGEYLAGRMMSDLIWLRALPATVERIGNVWMISSHIDWLATESGATTEMAFSRVLPFAIAGQNSMRSEVLLSAFTDAVVTWGQDGVKWINGNESTVKLPSGIKTNRETTGRVVIFVIGEVEKFPRK